MSEYYFEALNGYGGYVTKNGKHVLYKRTHSCGSIKFNNEDIESQIQLAGGFKSGWCELDNYWVIDTNQNSNELKKICQVGCD